MRTSPLAIFLFASLAHAQLCNVKVVTDASPDYADLPSMVHSITSRWETPAEKCWAVFYWNHIARRQTNPMHLHGMALTDPIRQFNDYGYTMCSTISGVNCGIWNAMGLKARYWDISNHTVSEVFYDGRWHMYDNSMSALYTLCDGKTLAGVEDIGKAGACGASEGRTEPGHIARYHCLNATSPRGFLTGADTIRSLDEEYRCFNPNGLKYRSYFYDWDFGHRYILNLRPGEEYTRTYRSLGQSAEYYVPNQGKDPEQANPRYRIRGNGAWTFQPSLKPGEVEKAAYELRNIAALPGGGLRAADPGQPGIAVFKVTGANVITFQKIAVEADGGLRAAASQDNGLHWKDVSLPAALVDEVNGAYEVLVRFTVEPGTTLKSIRIDTLTQVNSKTQPRLNLGRNTVYVGAGDQADSIVFWPDLQGDGYRQHIVEERNIASLKRHPGYQGVVYPAKAREDAVLVYRLDAPRDIQRLTYGGRFYNRAPRSRIDLLHSFDAGKTWTRSWTLTDTAQPWDVIHYETIAVPAGCRSVLAKYVMNTTDASQSGCSIYAIRIEANHLPVDPGPAPVEVRFAWKELQKDGSLVEQSHTQLAPKLPFRYTIDVGGEDHPVMESLGIRLAAPGDERPQGYASKPPAAAEKYVGRWVTYGKNLAVDKPYTSSHPSIANWNAGDPDGKKLTDGIAGPPCAGGASYATGALWNGNTNPVITLDLGKPTVCASFGMNFHGYEFHDALKGQVQDQVEVLVSEDGKAYTSLGLLPTRLRWKDLPVNHMWPDEETISGHTFRLISKKPVTARYVRYKITSRRFFCATELEILDSIRFDPFDLRIALP